tara:strand:- start:4553 stop:4894 length:342 start_codon:yes stop_codon:yes gene_type:complete
VSRDLITFFILLLVGQVLVWVQSNIPLLWKPARENLLFICLVAPPISYLFIKSTLIGYEYFENTLWPVRIIGFVCGTVVFSIMTYLFMGEGINLKTLISLFLCFLIIIVQLVM